MTRLERRLLIDTGVLGVLLTLLAAVLGATGSLGALERLLYDVRARTCQFFTAPPTDKLVHLDIDERSLEIIGRWPWPRSELAAVIDEIRVAGARALAMDVILSEPQPPGYAEVSDASPQTAPATRPAASGEAVLARRVDHDEALAAALKRMGRAVIAVSLTLSLSQPSGPAFRSMVAELFQNPALTREEMVRLLRQRGHDAAEALRAATDESVFLAARREAIFARIDAEMKSGGIPFDELRRRVFPGLPDDVASSAQIRLLQEGLRRWQAVRAMRRFARPITERMPPLLTTREEQAAIPQFADAAAAIGFVDYLPLEDGVVRQVPLWVNHRDFALPQLGLALACVMLDVDGQQVDILPDRVVIPRRNGRPVTIPVSTISTPRGRGGTFMHLPFFGRAGPGQWESMYDYPRFRSSRNHLPVHFVWAAADIRRRIAINNASIDSALVLLLSEIDLSAAQKYLSAVPETHDSATRAQLAERVLERLQKDGTIEFYAAMKDEDLTPEERLKRDKMLASAPALRRLVGENRALEADLASRRAEIRARLEGRAVLLGYTAMGAIADVVPTSLHPRCPGVVLHGLLFNSIMTGEFWRPAPGWAATAATAVMGLLATLAVARLSAWRALASAALLIGGWLVFNGVYLFDYWNVLVDVAAPPLAVIAVWSGGTLLRFVLEATERKRVTSRFRNYVDPALVDYVLESDNARLDGQEKELTVVFTDMENSTALAETLKGAMVGLLNEYMAAMVPVIRRHGGYVNKFLGDGIMFFFGAPRENPRHAADAIASLLEMLKSLEEFNHRMVQRGLPAVGMRGGVSTGLMVVGDAGPADGSASDYTVLGDAVNLGARLESANKFFGTRILVNARARQLAGDEFLFRPVGTIRVKGKTEGVAVFEPLCRADAATPHLAALAEATAAVVGTYAAGRFEECLEKIRAFESAFGPARLADLYRSLCEQHLRQPPAGTFDAQIILTEK